MNKNKKICCQEKEKRLNKISVEGTSVAEGVSE